MKLFDAGFVRRLRRAVGERARSSPALLAEWKASRRLRRRRGPAFPPGSGTALLVAVAVVTAATAAAPFPWLLGALCILALNSFLLALSGLHQALILRAFDSILLHFPADSHAVYRQAWAAAATRFFWLPPVILAFALLHPGAPPGWLGLAGGLAAALLSWPAMMGAVALVLFAQSPGLRPDRLTLAGRILPHLYGPGFLLTTVFGMVLAKSGGLGTGLGVSGWLTPAGWLVSSWRQSAQADLLVTNACLFACAALLAGAFPYLYRQLQTRFDVWIDFEAENAEAIAELEAREREENPPRPDPEPASLALPAPRDWTRDGWIERCVAFLLTPRQVQLVQLAFEPLAPEWTRSWWRSNRWLGLALFLCWLARAADLAQLAAWAGPLALLLVSVTLLPGLGMPLPLCLPASENPTSPPRHAVLPLAAPEVAGLLVRVQLVRCLAFLPQCLLFFAGFEAAIRLLFPRTPTDTAMALRFAAGYVLALALLQPVLVHGAFLRGRVQSNGCLRLLLLLGYAFGPLTHLGICWAFAAFPWHPWNAVLVVVDLALLLLPVLHWRRRWRAGGGDQLLHRPLPGEI